MTAVEKDTSGHIRVVKRALTVLSSVGDAPHGVTLHQLHQSSGIPLGSLHRILGTLEATRFLSRSVHSKRYSIGPSVLRLAQRQQQPAQLVEPPAPLIELANQTHETVFLTQLVDSRVVCVALVEAQHPLRLFVRIGQEMPLHAAASARAILAFRDPVLVEALLTAHPRSTYTDGTLAGTSAVMDHLALVLSQGFDVCSSELDYDVWAVGAPVHDALGRVDYAVTLAAASTRMTTVQERAEAVHAVLCAARTMSAHLDGSDSTSVPSLGDLRDHPAVATLHSEK